MSKLKYLFEKHQDFFGEQQKEIGQMLRRSMNLHWHKGRQYPSVTSIINPTGYSRFVAPYASRGTIVHYLIRHYIETGQWLDWQGCDVLEKDIYIVETSKRCVRIEDANYKGFFKSYGGRFKFDRDSLEQRFFNEEYFFAGRPDVRGWYWEGQAILVGQLDHWLKSVVEVKTIGTYKSKELEAIFMQLAAYAYGSGDPSLAGICIPLNGKTKNGFSEPIVCKNLEKYWRMFLKKRQALEDLYGI